MYRKTYVKINLDNIAHNVKNILENYSKYNYYIGVVKGSAYGHGAYIVKTLIANGINYLAVSNLDEAIEIRKYDKKIPILCLEPIDVDYLEICANNKITITVSSEEYTKKIKNTNLKLYIHLKIDSGMNRLGFDNPKVLKKCYESLRQNNNLFIEGIYTHMGTLGIGDQYWDKQLAEFKKITQQISLKDIPIVHIDRSATMLCHPKIDICNGVRIGIALYGYGQTVINNHGFKQKLRNLRRKYKIKKFHISNTEINKNINLKPALSLYSEIMEIKDVYKDEFVGYLGFVNKKEKIRVATANIGYADGIPLSARGGYVAINGSRYEIIGTINMGMISIRVDDKVRVGDTVEIIGDNIPASEVSSHNCSTVYQTMTSISPLLPRVYFKNNKQEKVVEGMK